MNIFKFLDILNYEAAERYFEEFLEILKDSLPESVVGEFTLELYEFHFKDNMDNAWEMYNTMSCFVSDWDFSVDKSNRKKFMVKVYDLVMN